MRTIMILYFATLAFAAVAIAAAESPEKNAGPRRVREINEQGYRIQLDLSSQVLRLEVPEDRGWANAIGDSRQPEITICPKESRISNLTGSTPLSAAVSAFPATGIES